jgi:peptide/nickel transport system substrate-binding protein
MNEWARLQAGLRNWTTSRREFLGQAAALGVSTALITQAIAQTPKRGGQLIVGIDGAATGNTLDPALYAATYMHLVGMQLYDQLTVLDERARVQPALAESWEAKPGAREWLFKLRKGVTFHNGKEFTAADVVYSLNHHRGKDSKSSAKALLASFTDIKAAGKDALTVTLDSGNADLPALLSEQRLCIGPDGSTFTDGVGTGPFALETFQPGVRTITKRNRNDWQSDRGFVESVETLAINDPTARLGALQSGAIHVMNKVDPRVVSQLEKQSQFQIFNISGGAHYTFPMRCDTPPFDNNDVRLALKYAIDREALVRTVLRGYGKVGNDNPIPSFDPFFAADIPQRPYDPDKAKFHIKKAGYGGPIVLSVADVVFPGAVDAAQLFQASAAKAGITVQIDRVPSDGYWDNIWMKKPFTASYWSGRATTDLMFAAAYTSDGKWNESFWRRPKFDELLLAARAELDPAKRRPMYREMQLMLYEDGGAIIPMFNNFIDAGAKRVRGFVPHPFGQMCGNRAPEKLWFES